jgi:hypothetical protein
MAKTPSSTKSESVTLRIPNEVFDQILNYAAANTKGNRSVAIVELINMGLVVAKQSTQTSLTAQQSMKQKDLSEAVTVLKSQMNQLTQLLQESVVQRLTVLEKELGELSA